MDVVVDQVVAVLEVLSLGDAVRTNQEVDLLGFLRKNDSLLLRPWGEEGEEGLEVVALFERALGCC